VVAPFSVLIIITTITTLLEDVLLKISSFTLFCGSGNYQKINKKTAKKSLFLHIQKQIPPTGRSQIDSVRASVSKSQGKDKQVWKSPAD